MEKPYLSNSERRKCSRGTGGGRGFKSPVVFHDSRKMSFLRFRLLSRRCRNIFSISQLNSWTGCYLTRPICEDRHFPKIRFFQGYESDSGLHPSPLHMRLSSFSAYAFSHYNTERKTNPTWMDPIEAFFLDSSREKIIFYPVSYLHFTLYFLICRHINPCFFVV
jgi:hypothetical protein